MATIPRCNFISELVQKSLHTAGIEQHDLDLEDCHNFHHSKKDAQISQLQNCECSLAKFNFVSLSKFNPGDFIGFEIQSIRVLNFALDHWNSTAQSGPEPPYPKIFFV
ncbi:MAG: hypothetical protein NTX25_02570 [Proteobacteria bacterium]|nr:hypothetical protein [Pseudomonadota bacterium]